MMAPGRVLAHTLGSRHSVVAVRRAEVFGRRVRDRRRVSRRWSRAGRWAACWGPGDKGGTARARA